MIQISNKVFYVGVNDRKKALFENNWPLPCGVAYNSYIIADEHPALIDTLEYGSNSDYLGSISNAIGGRDLEFLIVNHLEPDHSSMIGDVLRAYPQAKVVANCRTFKILESYFSIPSEKFLEITDGSILDLGFHKLTFVMTPWVHWPETMMTYDTTDKILFSCDAFGSFGTLDGGMFDDEIDFDLYYESEMRRYYSNIVGKWSSMVQKAFSKLAGVSVNFICPSHGPIWRENPSKVLSLYDKWSRNESEKGVVIAYASMYGNTEKMADYLARLLSEEGLKHIRIFDVSKTHPSYILSEIWKYNGLILGSCAYNATMHPMMSLLTQEIAISDPKNKVLGIFGASSWNGAGAKALREFAERVKMPVIGEVVQVSGSANEEKMDGFKEFVKSYIKEL
jgi:flavorubredoxin